MMQRERKPKQAERAERRAARLAAETRKRASGPHLDRKKKESREACRKGKWGVE